MGTVWKRQVALQQHSCPQISEDGVLPQLVWRSPSIREPASAQPSPAATQCHPDTHRENPPVKQSPGFSQLLQSLCDKSFWWSITNRCLNSTGIGRKRWARGINMIAFNPNLTTFTHSAAELCHCFRGNQGMEKKKGKLREKRTEAKTVHCGIRESQNGWGWMVLLCIRQSNQPFSISRDTYSKVPRITSRNNHRFTE